MSGTDQRPTLDALLEAADDIRHRAMARVRTYVTRDGALRTAEDPDYRSALAALEFTAKLAGYMGDGRNMTVEQVKEELDRMGYRLEPKQKPTSTEEFQRPRQEKWT